MRQDDAPRRAGSRSLSVVIPAYNEEHRLPRTVEWIHAFLLDRAHDAEIVVVNDGSRDRTREVLEALQRRLPMLRAIHHATNTGKGFAVKTGMLTATRQAVLCCDADHSATVDNIDRLWPRYDEGYDLVVGSRMMAGSTIVVRQPWRRRIAGRVFRTMTGFLGLRSIRDSQCGFKLFRLEAARSIFSRLRTNGFAFDVEVLLRARRLGFRIGEVPVVWTDDANSRIRIVRDSLSMLGDLLRITGGL